MFQFFLYFLSIIGLYVLVFYLYENLRTPTKLFLCGIQEILGLQNTATFIQKYGKWAAITGATDGIGKAYARELARHGINVMLISRNEEKLRKVADEIKFDFGVETRIVEADFSKGKEACKCVENELSKLPVKILVNNVGQSTPEPGPMAAFSDEELWDVILTNIGPVTQFCRFFIRRLSVARQTGLIVNVSSGTENFPLPNGAIYAATKAYVRSLTLALQQEAHPHGIDVQLLSPHFVVTKINSYSRYVMRGNRFIPDVETFAKSAVNRLGKLDHTTGYCWHDLELAGITALPSRLRNYVMRIIAKMILTRSKMRML